jgi:hypothetical protein
MPILSNGYGRKVMHHTDFTGSVLKLLSSLWKR